LVSATKDPAKVRAGQLGALRRWGDTPRIVRLDSLDLHTRAAVLELIRAGANAQDTTKK
jgi:hypothetical protein